MNMEKRGDIRPGRTPEVPSTEKRSVAKGEKAAAEARRMETSRLDDDVTKRLSQAAE